MTESDLLSELAAELCPPMLDPEVEVTAAMVAEHSHVGLSLATRTLKLKEAQGVLVSRLVKLPNGHVATAWRKRG